MEEIAHWWNGSWGAVTRRDVWLSQLDDGWYEIRWSGGDWRDREGCCWRSTAAGAIEALRSLLGDDLAEWRDLAAVARMAERMRPS